MGRSTSGCPRGRLRESGEKNIVCEQQQLYAKEVQPQPEPVVNAAAATAAAAVLAAAA